MAITEQLLRLGYKPAGTGGGALEKISNVLRQIGVSFQKQEEKSLEDKKKKADMYRTLRQSGYSPERAYKVIESGDTFPKPDGGVTLEEEKTRAGIEKDKALTEKYRKQTEVIGEKEEEIDPFKGSAEWKSKAAQKELVTRFVQAARAKEKAAGRGRDWLPGANKFEKLDDILRNKEQYMDEKGGYNLPAIFRSLGISQEEFYSWARTNAPELFKKGFPAKSFKSKAKARTKIITEKDAQARLKELMEEEGKTRDEALDIMANEI